MLRCLERRRAARPRRSSDARPEVPLPGACETPIAALSRSSARLQVDVDGTLRDEHGRDVQLRGVNAGGRSKWSPFVPFPIAGVGSSTSMGVTRDGTFLVVESKSDDVISVFALDAAGKPTAVTNSPFAMDVSADASGLVIAE